MSRYNYQCDQCGFKINHNLKACSDCGSVSYTRTTIKAKRKSPKVALLLGSMALLGAAMGGVFFQDDLLKMLSGSDPHEEARVTITRFYDLVQNGKYGEFDEVFADQLEQWFAYQDISLDQVAKSEKYRRKFPIQASSIQWETLELSSNPDGSSDVSYILDYKCRAEASDPWMIFEIDVDLKLDENARIARLTENILKKTMTYFYDNDGDKVSNRGKADYFGQFTFDENDDIIGVSRMYYLNEQIKFEGRITRLDKYDVPMEFSGTVKWFHPNGKLAMEEKYTNDGIYDGGSPEWFKTWEYNGQISSSTILHYSGMIDKQVTNSYDLTGGLERQVIMTREGEVFITHTILCSAEGCNCSRKASFLDLDGKPPADPEFLWIGEEHWTRTKTGLTNISDNTMQRGPLEIHTPIDVGFADFDVSVQLVNPNPSSSLEGGLLINYDDAFEQLRFTISHEGFGIYTYKNGLKTVNEPLTMSSQIRKTKWNMLTLTKANGRLNAKINGQVVAVMDVPSASISGFGMISPSQSDGYFGFKEFELNYPESPETLQ